MRPGAGGPYGEFADFWTAIEGSWWDKHAYYDDSTIGCFSGATSRSRRYLGLQVIGFFVALPVFGWIALQAVNQITNSSLVHP